MDQLEQLSDEERLDAVTRALARAIDGRSPSQKGHGARVAHYAAVIAGELGLPPRRRSRLVRGALLHDVGKLAVSKAILDKPGPLTAEEFAAVKLHPLHSESMLGAMPGFRDLAAMAGAHHERLDGRGYPRGLKACDIGLETRILTVADVYDALTADRPYRRALPRDRALGLMARDIGAAFDADCFAALAAGLVRAPRRAA